MTDPRKSAEEAFAAWWEPVARVAAEEAAEFGGDTAAKAVWHAVKCEAARFGVCAEMLSALKELVAGCRDARFFGSDLDRAENIIAKAEGKS